MPTAAIAAYGTQLLLGDGVIPGALVISGATNTTPIVLTTVPHGQPLGYLTWMEVTGVTGNAGANGSWVTEALSPTTLKLRASIGNGTYSGGGLATPRNTFATVAELVNITPIGISFNMVAADAHDGNGWGSSIPTFKRGVDMRLELNLVPAHPTHDETTGFIGLALGKIRRDWMIVLPDVTRTAIVFQAWVSDHGTVAPFDGVLKANPVLSIDGAMFFAGA